MNEDEWEYIEDQAASEFIDDAIRQMSEESARSYLGSYGDAIEARVMRSIQLAQQTRADGYPESAIVHAATAAELMIRFMLVQPLVQGAFLSDIWAEILAGRITRGQSAEDRKLLPAVLRQWSIDLDSIRLKDGTKLWEAITSGIWPRRNKVVHAGDCVLERDCDLAIEAAELLLSAVVRAVASRLGFTLETTKCWSEIRVEKTSEDGTKYCAHAQSFRRESPFEMDWVQIPNFFRINNLQVFSLHEVMPPSSRCG